MIRTLYRWLFPHSAAEAGVPGITLPSCFGSLPEAQARAENGCADCKHADRCLITVLPDTPFAFGSRTWPGLAKLAEESGEVGQVLGKLIQTGGEPCHFDGSNLIEKLAEELPDLAAAIEVFIRLNPVLEPHRKSMRDRRQMKIERFQGWHRDNLQ